MRRLVLIANRLPITVRSEHGRATVVRSSGGLASALRSPRELTGPLRDGMNLVAKEYVASRVDGDGVLVLSEFAGAAAQLHDALIVNPYDLGAVSSAIIAALDMPEGERRARMGALRVQVANEDVTTWVAHSLEELDAARPYRATEGARRSAS